MKILAIVLAAVVGVLIIWAGDDMFARCHPSFSANVPAACQSATH